jgi:hypothetical protein
MGYAWGVRRLAPLLVLLLLGARQARADRPVCEALLDVAHLWTSEIGQAVGDLTFDLVELSFDVRKGVTRLSLGGGGDDFTLRIDGDIRMQNGWARVRAHCDLRLAGSRLRFALPDFDVTSHTIYGERAVVVRVPIFEGKF